MRTAVCAVCLLCVFAIAAAAIDSNEFLPLAELRPGMTGIGRTIVAGDEPSEFAVEILGVIDQPGDEDDFIVVRVSGPAIGRAGGIAQGMSGSPVYVDGRLIGALSRAANWSKDLMPIGLVTPIEPMLAVLDAMAEPPSTASPEALLNGFTVVSVDDPLALAFDPGTPETVVAAPISTPLLTTGLSQRAAAALLGTERIARPDGLAVSFLPIVPAADEALAMNGLSRFGFSLHPLAAAPNATFGDPADLVAAGSMGVALATGDVSVGALGTITYRDEDLLVGFGHPFIQNGHSAFPLTAVQIIDTMKAYDASFKLGSLGRSLGTVLEDRAVAVGAALGELPPMIDVAIKATDEDAGVSRTSRVQIVPESRLLPELMYATGITAADETLDRIGPGTVEVTFAFNGHGLPAPITRRDVFVSATDVAVYPAWQLADLVAYLEFNTFVAPQLTTVSMTMSITEEIRAVEIGHLEIDQYIYYPGEAVRYRLELQTYHGERRVVEGEIVIPEDLITFTDTIAIRAYGGPRLREAGESPTDLASIEDIARLIEELPSNDLLTVELFALDVLAPYSAAWVGIDLVEIPLDGNVVFGEREIIAYLVEDE